MGNQNNIKAKDEKKIYSNGDEYIGFENNKGEMLDDLRDGEGEYRWKNKDRYEG